MPIPLSLAEPTHVPSERSAEMSTSGRGYDTAAVERDIRWVSAVLEILDCGYDIVGEPAEEYDERGVQRLLETTSTPGSHWYRGGHRGGGAQMRAAGLVRPYTRAPN